MKDQSTSPEGSFFLRLNLKNIPKQEEELITLRLFELGAFGVTQDLDFVQESQQYDPEIVESETLSLQAFFEVSQRELLEQSDLMKDFSSELKLEKNQDWLKEWKKHFKAFEVFSGLWIAPSWEMNVSSNGLKDITNDKAEKVIYIEPGLAFGTGTHATTKLCLSSINKLFSNLTKTSNKDSGIRSALDLGSGSSVLSIYLKFCGLDEVVACEIDE